MEFRRYKLFGYLNLFPGLSGFLYPVFLNNGSLYLANGNIRYIYSFSPLKTNYIPFVRKTSPATTESYLPRKSLSTCLSEGKRGNSFWN